MKLKTAAPPIRKEKAEVEALQATIEKMKVDHEQALKKWKLNEQRYFCSLAVRHKHIVDYRAVPIPRLTTNNAAQAAHIAELDQQMLAVDEDNLRLREFIHREGILLPKHLRAAPQRGSGSSPKAGGGLRGSSVGASSGGSGAGGKGRTAGGGRGYHGEEGYVEEVDVDVVDVSSSRHYADVTSATAKTSPRMSSTAIMPKKSAPVLSASSRAGKVPWSWPCDDTQATN
jgi:hypothetical protein